MLRSTEKASLRQEAVMSEGSVFRLFSEEAMRESSNVVGESEKRALEELAVIWAQAALMSDRVFGLSFTSSPHPLDEAISRAPLLMEGC
jgi:hypothetical protein